MRWLDELYKPVFGGYPLSGITWDTETTGFHKEDLIVEIGHCVFENGKPLYFENHVLNWVDHPSVELDWLEYRLQKVRESMANNDRVYQMTITRMKKLGRRPEDVLEEYRKLLLDQAKRRQAIVGHGHLRFDIPRLQAACQEYLGKSLELPSELLIDTMSVEKAIEMCMPNRPGESPAEFMKRLANARCAPGVQVNLDEACMTKYGWNDRYELDLDEAHTAGFDALLCHYLMEDHRAQIGKKKKDGK